jgi:iron complex outermembrane receptor protein
VGTVVDAGPTLATLPKGVTGLTTYSAVNGLATRGYNASWSSPSGTAGIEWTPDSDSLLYFKYGRGYKSGGYNIGIFTVLSFSPWTDSEHVDSFEIGFKHTFGHFLTANVAAFWYNYDKLQIPIAQINTSGGLAQSSTAFYNVPNSVSRGIELETTWTPMEHLSILFNYSWLDSYITNGTAADPADPNAVEPNAKPLYTAAQCLANLAAHTPTCTTDVFTETFAIAQAVQAAGGAAPGSAASYGGVIPGDANQGWNIPQSLKGNPLPNAPRNKIAVNVLYDWHLSNGWRVLPSLSYVWRDKEYGIFFPEAYNAAPAWDEWDTRLSITSASGKFTAILFVKNIFDTIGYDQGALGTRAAGTTDYPTTGNPGSSYTTINYVQGLNGPVGYNGHVAGSDKWSVFSTYYPAPPRTVGIELHYKFY